MSTESDSDLIGDLLNELEEARTLAAGFASDLLATRELLSEALTQLAALTTRCTRQTATIRRLMGIIDPERSHDPPLSPLPDDAPPEMMREREMRWTPFNGR